MSSEAPGQGLGRREALSGAPHARALVGATDLIGAHSTPGRPWLERSSVKILVAARQRQGKRSTQGIAHCALSHAIIENRTFKRPVSSTRKVQLGLGAVKHAKSRSRIGDFPGHSSARGAKYWDVLASRAGAGQRGLSAQGNEPDWVSDWLGIRPLAVMRMAAWVLGAVPGRTSRDG